MAAVTDHARAALPAILNPAGKAMRARMRAVGLAS